MSENKVETIEEFMAKHGDSKVHSSNNIKEFTRTGVFAKDDIHEYILVGISSISSVINPDVVAVLIHVCALYSGCEPRPDDKFFTYGYDGLSKEFIVPVLTEEQVQQKKLMEQHKAIEESANARRVGCGVFADEEDAQRIEDLLNGPVSAMFGNRMVAELVTGLAIEKYKLPDPHPYSYGYDCSTREFTKVGSLN